MSERAENPEGSEPDLYRVRVTTPLGTEPHEQFVEEWDEDEPEMHRLIEQGWKIDVTRYYIGRPAPTEPREEDGERAEGAETTKFNPLFSIFDLVEDPHYSLWDGNPEEGGSELPDHPRVPLAVDVKFEFVAGQVEVWVTNGPKGPPVVRAGDPELTFGGDLEIHWPDLAMRLNLV